MPCQTFCPNNYNFPIISPLSSSYRLSCGIYCSHFGSITSSCVILSLGAIVGAAGPRLRGPCVGIMNRVFVVKSYLDLPKDIFKHFHVLPNVQLDSPFWMRACKYELVQYQLCNLFCPVSWEVGKANDTVYSVEIYVKLIAFFMCLKKMLKANNALFCPIHVEVYACVVSVCV